MIAELLEDKQFQELEKEYKFLSRARGESLESLEYVILDIETTGLEPAQSELTEIGALKIKGSELKEVFSSLIRPKSPIPPRITQLTGIDDAMVKDFPGAVEILAKFHDFAGTSVLVAHNADFDIQFIKHHMKQLLDKGLNNNFMCTVKIARFLMPDLKNHKLHTVASHFGLRTENRHRAIGDAELTYQIWIRFLNMLKEKGITNISKLDSCLAGL